MTGAALRAALRLPGGVAALLCGVLAWPGGAAAQAPSDTLAGTLRTALWSASGAGETAAGAAAWLRGGGGELRLDLARFPAADAPPGAAWGRLLTRSGDGWTLVSGPAGAVSERWGAPLERVEEGVVLRLEVALALLEAGPEARPGLPAGVRLARSAGGATSRRPADRPAVWSVGLPAVGSLRERLVARGLGAGGTGEVWRCEWEPADAAQPPVAWEGGGEGVGGRLRVRSSRLPGELRVTLGGTRSVAFVPEDAFVPLWGLSEVVLFPEGEGAGLD